MTGISENQEYFKMGFRFNRVPPDSDLPGREETP